MTKGRDQFEDHFERKREAKDRYLRGLPGADDPPLPPPVEPINPKLKPTFDSIVNVYRAEFERYKTEGLSSPNKF